MKSEQLIGKQVIGAQAQIIGKVYEIELDTKAWTITDIYIDLENTVVEAIGLQKPRIMGSVKISIPVEEVNAISDLISLKKSAVELRGIAKRV